MKNDARPNKSLRRQKSAKRDFKNKKKFESQKRKDKKLKREMNKKFFGNKKRLTKSNKKGYRMGLDQYIFKEVSGEYEEDGRSKVQEVHYWRKNYQLNDWACDNFCPDYIADFNCERLPLKEFMVDDLIKHILWSLDQPKLDSDGYDGLISESTLNSFLDCKERLKGGEILYYVAWW